MTEIMVGQPFDCAQGRSHPTAIAGIGGTKTVLERKQYNSKMKTGVEIVS